MRVSSSSWQNLQVSSISIKILPSQRCPDRNTCISLGLLLIHAFPLVSSVYALSKWSLVPSCTARRLRPLLVDRLSRQIVLVTEATRYSFFHVSEDFWSVFPSIVGRFVSQKWNPSWVTCSHFPTRFIISAFCRENLDWTEDSLFR